MQGTFYLLLQGAKSTLEVTCVSLSLGALMGVVLGILNSHKWRNPAMGNLIHLFVSLIRGTPLFVQVLIFYFALPEILNIHLSPFTAGILALGLNSSAYISEIVRCGIDSIPEGQWEAAFVLGYGRFLTTFYIIIPQMLRNVLPALTNEVTALIKETSILMVIGVSELTKVGRDIVSRELDPLKIYLFVAVIYYTMTTAASSLLHFVERRLK